MITGDYKGWREGEVFQWELNANVCVMVKATFKVIAVIAHTPIQIGLSKTITEAKVVW